MKRIFTFAIALLSFFAIASAANVTFTVTVPFDAAKPTTNMTYECYLVGNFQGWAISTAPKMTKVDDTHYTITLDDATFVVNNGVQVTTANLQYKYACGNDASWAYIEKYADGSEMKANRAYALGTVNTHESSPGVVDDTSVPGTNGVDVVLRWAAVYNPNVAPVPMDVEINALTPAGTLECYIAGNFNNWAGPTAANCKMTKVSTEIDGTVIFNITIHSDDVNKLAYNLCSGPDWSYQQKTPSGDFKYPEVNPIVTEWKAIFDPSKVGNITITATVPAGTTDVWVNGSFVGWNFPNSGNNGTGGIKCTKNIDGTFSFTAPLVQNIEYKMYNGQSWNNVEVDALGVEVANRKAAYPADATAAITVVGWKTPSAVSQVKAATNVIYTNNSIIVVEGVTSNVALFDITGRRIQSEKMVGTFTSKSLNTGLYIVQVDGATRKVAVK